MSSTMANDVKAQYDKSFATVRGIIEAFPEDKWLTPHGDDYYIPSRIAYHLAGFIDGFVAGGMKDPDFRSKAPFGNWYEGTAETLPDKAALLGYYDAVIDRAKKNLADLNDDGLAAPMPEEMSRFGATHLGMHLLSMREIAAHAGELNKMLIENGKDDVWF